jgi:phage tail protein X
MIFRDLLRFVFLQGINKKQILKIGCFIDELYWRTVHTRGHTGGIIAQTLQSEPGLFFLTCKKQFFDIGTLTHKKITIIIVLDKIYSNMSE